MSQDSLPPEITKALPGALGAVVALRWVVGTPIQRLAAVLGGSGISYYGGEYFAQITQANVGFISFMAGLFGMSIVHRVMDFIGTVDIGKRMDKILSKWGL